jgi:hypothetical protein
VVLQVRARYAVSSAYFDALGEHLLAMTEPSRRLSVEPVALLGACIASFVESRLLDTYVHGGGMRRYFVPQSLRTIIDKDLLTQPVWRSLRE